MELNKLMLAMIAASSMALVACGGSSDSDDDDAPTPPPAVNPPPVTETDECSVGTGTESEDTYVLGEGDDAQEVTICDLEGVISESTTLTTDYVYRLNGYVTVGDGADELAAYTDASEVTLTINEGVQFRSSGRGSLIISRGSMISANGTEDAPIVMASEDYNFEGQGEWGGLVVQGFAQNNQCVAEYDAGTICNTDDEAGTGFHGGEDDSDNSGNINYLIVAEGGFEVAPDSEVNGITLHSVGYGTDISNIAVLNNADDGIEFFGGAANVKNIVLVDNGDESIDWDDGYRGNIQYGYVLQNAEHESDHGIEADSLGKEGSVVANPAVANITFMSVNDAEDELMNLKKDTQGVIEKIYATGYAADECAKLDGDATEVVIADSDLADCDGITFQKNDDDSVTTLAEITVNGKMIDKDTADKSVTPVTELSEETTTQNADNNNNSFMEATDFIGAGDASEWAAWVAPYSAPLEEALAEEE